MADAKGAHHTLEEDKMERLVAQICVSPGRSCWKMAPARSVNRIPRWLRMVKVVRLISVGPDRASVKTESVGIVSRMKGLRQVARSAGLTPAQLVRNYVEMALVNTALPSPRSPTPGRVAPQRIARKENAYLKMGIVSCAIFIIRRTLQMGQGA